jgi:proteasome assembly chaperone (PAC2) family protein
MKTFDQITFDGSPTVLAAWPGMGNVGLIGVDYLRRKLGAVLFAEIDMSPYFIPDSIIVKNGIAEFPEIPSASFYYTKNPDLIIFECNAQVAGREGIMVIKNILDIITQHPVRNIFTFAAFAQPMSHQDDSHVLYACNSPGFLDGLNHFGLNPMPDGYIAGQNGLLLGVAASRNVPSACLLGTIPSYAINLSYPKASLELVKSICGLLNLEIDYTELLEGVEAMAQQFAMVEERIRELTPFVKEEEEDEEISSVDEEKVPHYVMDKIEKMFVVAAKDKSMATELKKELDRWKLFELYENRFLDLFDENKRKKQD